VRFAVFGNDAWRTLDWLWKVRFPGYLFVDALCLLNPPSTRLTWCCCSSWQDCWIAGSSKWGNISDLLFPINDDYRYIAAMNTALRYVWGRCWHAVPAEKLHPGVPRILANLSGTETCDWRDAFGFMQSAEFQAIFFQKKKKKKKKHFQSAIERRSALSVARARQRQTQINNISYKRRLVAAENQVWTNQNMVSEDKQENCWAVGLRGCLATTALSQSQLNRPRSFIIDNIGELCVFGERKVPSLEPYTSRAL